MILISIIVPAYNAEKYINQCFNSILAQNYSFWELIVINDGSIDSTAEICDRYSLNDKRIKVFHINNSGVSNARNLGLRQVSGQWVMFIDADDWIEPNTFSLLIERIQNSSADLIGFNHFYNYPNKEIRCKGFKPNPLIRKDDELIWFALDMIFPAYDSIVNKVFVGNIRAVWGKIFKYSIIKEGNLSFDTRLKIAEDGLFCFEYLQYCQQMNLYDDYLIHYRVHQSSANQKYMDSVDNVNDQILKTFESLITNSRWEKENYEIALYGLTSDCIFRSLRLNYLHPDNKDTFIQNYKNFCIMLDSENYRKRYNYSAQKYLPHGKREIMYLAKKKLYLFVYFLGWISIKLLNLKKI